VDLDGPIAPPLNALERIALALPLVGSAALGLALYVFPRPFARVAGLAGDDLLVYELGGAAMLGYAVVLVLGARRMEWRSLRLVVTATYAFAGITVLDGIVTFASGVIDGFAVLTTIWAVIVGWSVGQLLVARRGMPGGPRDVASWVVPILVLATLSAAVFGLGPQAPGPFAALMGYRGTDEYVYRIAGAACFGYAVMGVMELRSRQWDEMRLPNVMALVFNALAFVAAVLEILAGRSTVLAVLVAAAAGAFTVAIGVVLVRRGH
jgi:hypothetical protein